MIRLNIMSAIIIFISVDLRFWTRKCILFYRSAYAKNPFDNVSAEELQEYQRIIDSKSRQGDGKSY